jgi:hypothetical protein
MTATGIKKLWSLEVSESLNKNLRDSSLQRIVANLEQETFPVQLQLVLSLFSKP